MVNTTCLEPQFDLGQLVKIINTFTDEDFKSFHVSSENCPRIPEDFLRKERQRMTKAEYRQEYLGEFIDEWNQFFTTKLIHQCMDFMEWDLEKDGIPGSNYYLGVDIARYGGDNNAFVVSELQKDRMKIVKCSETDRVSTVDTIGRVVNIEKEFNFNRIFVDDAGVGGAVTDVLIEKLGNKVLGLNNASKRITVRQTNFSKVQKRMNLDEDFKMRGILKEDLCKHELSKLLQPSKKVFVTGILRTKPIKNSENLQYVIEAIEVQIKDETYQSFRFKDEEVASFKELAKQPDLIDTLAQSVFPEIHGNFLAKKAITLQLFGSPHVMDENGSKIKERGNLHIFLLSNPGSAKSQMLKRAIEFVPGSRFGGGKGVTGAGLIGAVVKDEELGGFSLEAGVIPKCNNAIFACDELDKVNKDDIAMLNNALVDMRVTIDKASVHTTLDTDVSLLGAANPIHRIFDKHEAIWQQISLPKDFLDRFDLIIVLESIMDDGKQEQVADIIFGKYTNSESNKPLIEKEIVMRYIAYSKIKIKPTLTTDVIAFIKEKFIDLTRPTSENEGVFMSSRLLTNLIRLTLSSARLHLRTETIMQDAEIAIGLMFDSLKKQNILKDGAFDMMKLEGVTPKIERDLISTIRNKIPSDDILKEEDLITQCIQEGIDRETAERKLEHLKRSGDVFSPKQGFVRRIL